MSLADEYRRQFVWRDWDMALDALPSLQGTKVLDLGCGVGDVAGLLSDRGARVVGVDLNAELLAAARVRGIRGAEFRTADLRSLSGVDELADGIWSSFAIAYFTEPEPVVLTWAEHLRPGGWIALVEIDDLFAHQPLGERSRSLLASYCDDALTAGRYDFRMGRRLRPVLERSGFTVLRELDLADAELAFDGPARADVIDGWRTRLDRMKLLHAHCGAAFEQVRSEFLDCLGRADHRSRSRVRCCIATRGTTPGSPAG